MGIGLFAVLSAAGCDFGDAEHEPSLGPPLHLIASFPTASEGMDCSLEELPECGVSIAAPLELRFDRFLAPDTATRQSVSVTSGPVSVFLQPEYDLLEQVVAFRLPLGQTLRPGTRYDVELHSADEHREGWGFRAFDGAPLSESGSVPLRFSFRTRAAAEPPAPTAPLVTFSAVQEVLDKGGCAAAICHQPASSGGCPDGEARLGASGCVSVPRMGLDLASPSGIQATALGRAARQTQTGPRAGVPLEDPPRFGVNMPVIDPGRAENSYLVFKLLAHPDVYPAGACSSRYAVAPGDTCGRPSDDELSRLYDWFLVGAPMPAEDAGLAGTLDLEDLRVVTTWIRQGADLSR